jgi:hypothetical protein
MYAEDYQTSSSTWEEWLANYLPNSASDTWLADWRGPVPLLPECWGELPKPWRRKPLVQFSAALGLSEPNRTGWLILYGHYRFGKDSHNGDVYVSSVQVAPEAANSLFWALHSTKKKDQAFPTFGLNDREEDLSNENELPSLFNLLPILAEKDDSQEKGIERHDSSARDIHPAYPMLSQDLITRCNLTVINGGRHYQDNTGTLVAECEAWDDDLRDKRSSYNYEAYSSGFRLWIRQDTLLAYLATTEQILLMQATLSRNTENHSSTNRENSYDLGKRRLALLHADGTIQTVAGHCSLGETNIR